jgi:rod shape determining protein RodA
MRSTSVWRYFDVWLAAAVILLTAYGILAIRSAVTGAPAFEDLPQRQVLFAIIGIAVMLVIASLDYRILTSSHWYVYFAVIASLVIVYLAGVINNDSRRWIDLGIIQIQPSEFGRIFLAITFAQFLVQRQHLMGRFSNTLVSILYIAIPVGLIFLQPDLGMSILFLVVWFVMIWLAGLPLSHFAVMAIVGIVAIVALYPSLADYQQDRIRVFLEPESLPEQSFNIDQALISIGSGGWFGKGYLQGTQSQLGFLRVQHTDGIDLWLAGRHWLDGIYPLPDLTSR